MSGQGHHVKFLGEGIHHALHCPCLYVFFPLNSSEKIPVYNIPTDLFYLFPFAVYKGGQNVEFFHVSQEPNLIDHKLHELPGDWSRLRWVLSM